MSDSKISLSALRAFPTHENHGEPGWITVHESRWKALLAIAEAALADAESREPNSWCKPVRCENCDSLRAALALVEK